MVALVRYELCQRGIISNDDRGENLVSCDEYREMVKIVKQIIEIKKLTRENLILESIRDLFDNEEIQEDNNNRNNNNNERNIYLTNLIHHILPPNLGNCRFYFFIAMCLFKLVLIMFFSLKNYFGKKKH